jgi:hypothetical protein
LPLHPQLGPLEQPNITWTPPTKYTKVQYYTKSQFYESSESEVDKNSVVDISSVKPVDKRSVENTALKLEELDEKALVYQSAFSPL